jgi:hypothetical protein
LGILNFCGADHQVAIPFQLAITASAVQMRGTVTIDRRWFGVGQGQFATPDAVAANVKVNIAIAARKVGWRVGWDHQACGPDHPGINQQTMINCFGVSGRG